MVVALMVVWRLVTVASSSSSGRAAEQDGVHGQAAAVQDVVVAVGVAAVRGGS